MKCRAILIPRLATIEFIAKQRRTHVGEARTNLMPSTRTHEFDLDQSDSMAAFPDRPGARSPMPSLTLVGHRDLLRALVPTGEMKDETPAPRHLTSGECLIDLSNLTILHLSTKANR